MRLPADLAARCLAIADGIPPAKVCRRRVPAKLAAPSLAVEVVVPVVTRSELNTRSWRDRSRRTQQARHAWAVLLALYPALAWWPDGTVAPYRVTLTRLGPKLLDSDNAAGAVKATRDLVAAWLGYSDAPDMPIAWTVQQRVSREYGVVVRVETGESNHADER